MEEKRVVPKTKHTLRLTGRKRIERDRVRLIFVLNEDGRAEAFQGDLDLRDLELPQEAEVIILVERGNDVERFEIGKVGNGSISIARRDLGEIGGYGLGLRCRVLVVDPHDRKILASAEKLRPITLREKSILPYIRSDRIGKLAWKIEFADEGPCLILNKKLPPGAFGSPYFVCYVLPAVLREILDCAIREKLEEGEFEEPDDESGDWKSQWLRFAEELTGRKPPVGSPDNPAFRTEYERWIEDVIQTFCERKINKDWERLIREYQHE
ncbi:MAG: hypothetical protein QXR87_04700 [Candidatus Hadarchaeales archaeon]